MRRNGFTAALEFLHIIVIRSRSLSSEIHINSFQTDQRSIFAHPSDIPGDRQPKTLFLALFGLASLNFIPLALKNMPNILKSKLTKIKTLNL